MAETFALISRETLQSIPGAVRKDGEVIDRWFTRAAKVWCKVAGRDATLQLGRKGTSADGGLWLVASPRDYFGAGAPDRMRVDFLRAMSAETGGGIRT